MKRIKTMADTKSTATEEAVAQEPASGLAAQVKTAKDKLLKELKAATETYAEFTGIGLTTVLTDSMFKDVLDKLDLQPRTDAPTPVVKTSKARKRKATGAPAEVKQEDKDKFLKALKTLAGSTGKSTRTETVAEKAGLDEKLAKAVKSALVADKRISANGSWIKPK